MAMYSLKQTHLAWHLKLAKNMNSLGFEELPCTPCVFMRRNEDGSRAYILVYVDDFPILTRILLQRSTLLEELNALYELRVDRRVSVYLGGELVWKVGKDGQLL